MYMVYKTGEDTCYLSDGDLTKSSAFSDWTASSLAYLFWPYQQANESGATRLLAKPVSGSSPFAPDKTDWSGAFSGLTTVTDVDLSLVKGGTLTNATNLFNGTNIMTGASTAPIENVTLNNWTFDGIPCAGMFASCPDLISVTGLKVTGSCDIGSMFYQCASIVEPWSVFDNPKPTDMAYLFSGCSKMASFDGRGWDVSGATTLRQLFSNCTSLKSVCLDGWDLSSVTDFQYMFSNCSGLEYLDLSSVSVPLSKEKETMFSGNTNLKVVLPWLDQDGLPAANFPYNDLNFYGMDGQQMNSATGPGNPAARVLVADPSIAAKAVTTAQVKELFDNMNDRLDAVESLLPR